MAAKQTRMAAVVASFAGAVACASAAALAGAPPTAPVAPAAAAPQAWTMDDEYKLQFAELQRQIGRPATDKVKAETFRPDSLTLASDGDAAGVVLRRTAALLDDLRDRHPRLDLAAERAELAALKARAAGAAISGREGRYELFTAACKLRRRVAFRNPLLDFRDVLFATHHRKTGGHDNGNHMCDQYFGFNAMPGGGIYVLEDALGSRPRVRDVLAGAVVRNGRLKGKPLAPGAFISPELSYDGRTVLFAYTEGERSKYVWSERSTYHVFRVGIDGSDLTQLTDGDWNDFDPCWLPGPSTALGASANGAASSRIVFISERRGGYGRCHPRKVPTFTLHTMRPDGSDIRCISFHETNEWQPSVDNAGMIVYTRWDYVDRGFQQAHHPWITAPDGRDARAIHGNFPPQWRNRPCMEMDVRAIPGSRRYVATAAAHHGQSYGSLVVIDADVEDDDTMSPLRRLTPEAPFPESEGGSSEAYGTAWPLSEDYYLCVYTCGRRDGRHGLYLMDSFGNRELLHFDPAIGALGAIPVRPRAMPSAIPAADGAARPAVPAVAACHNASQGGLADPRVVAGDANATGQIALMNVYDGTLPWPEGTRIASLRIIQVLPKTTPFADGPRIGYGSQKNARAVLGTVPVEADGSAHFELPANRPVYFQALDSNGRAVQSMRSDVYVRPGQRLTCQGCHDRRHRSPAVPAATPLALRRAASAIRADVDGSNPFGFPRLVQPVLDRNCVGCHARNAKAPVLTAKASHGPQSVGLAGWYASYKSLQKYAFFYQAPDFVVSRTVPGKFGALGSRLLNVLATAPQHKELKLSAEDMHRLTLWLDCNSDFYGWYENLEAQARGEVVRPALE